MSSNATKVGLPETDPAVYDIHHQTWETTGLPKDETEWIERASQVAKILAEDVTVRDREQKIPVAEVSLLKSSGLLKVLGPVKYGGGGQGWDVAYKAIREVAKGDG
jgi:alkylation response protein AidB-like acyl-CoA dehydrogenase